MANESQVAQHILQIAHNGQESQSLVAQHVVQVLTEAPVGIRFTDIDCTDLASKETLTRTEATGLSWAVLDSNDASAITGIEDQNNNLNITDGEGFIQTPDITPGSYIVILQDGTGKIGAYVMDAN